MAEETNSLDQMERAIASNRARLKSSRRVIDGLDKRLKRSEQADPKQNQAGR